MGEFGVEVEAICSVSILIAGVLLAGKCAEIGRRWRWFGKEEERRREIKLMGFGEFFENTVFCFCFVCFCLFCFKENIYFFKKLNK